MKPARQPQPDPRTQMLHLARAIEFALWRRIQRNATPDVLDMLFYYWRISSVSTRLGRQFFPKDEPLGEAMEITGGFKELADDVMHAIAFL